MAKDETEPSAGAGAAPGSGVVGTGNKDDKKATEDTASTNGSAGGGKNNDNEKSSSNANATNDD